jgi:Ca2+-binding RTX toxin-like protein
MSNSVDHAWDAIAQAAAGADRRASPRRRTVTILDEYNSPNRVENFRLDDGGSFAGVSLGNGNYSLVTGLTGTGANDIIAGSGAGETLSGAGGNDLLFGNGGNDTLRGGTGTNILDGGAGIDLLDFSDASSAITFALTQSTGFTSATLTSSFSSATVDVYRNMEGVIGSNFADTLTGSTFDDVLNGGGGKDTLVGGAGNDRLSGGTGADTFKYLADDLAGGGVDDILDFGTGASGDILDLSALLAAVAGNKADHVQFVYSDGSTQLASASGTPHAADGDVRVQVNLSGSTWTDVATIRDTGTNLSGGDEVIRMMLDATQSQVHV